MITFYYSAGAYHFLEQATTLYSHFFNPPCCIKGPEAFTPTPVHPTVLMEAFTLTTPIHPTVLMEAFTLTTPVHPTVLMEAFTLTTPHCINGGLYSHYSSPLHCINGGLYSHCSSPHGSTDPLCQCSHVGLDKTSTACRCDYINSC